MIEQQSIEDDPEKRKPLLWAIEKKLAEDGGRPITFYAPGGVCWQPQVKGLTIRITSIFSGNRREGRCLLDATQALHDNGSVPPLVDDPGITIRASLGRPDHAEDDQPRLQAYEQAMRQALHSSMLWAAE